MKVRPSNLFKRNGVYHVRWRVNGKLFTRSTRESNVKAAREKRDEIMAPFLAMREVDVLHNLEARIRGREAEVEKLNDDAHPPLKLDRGWRTFARALNRPDAGRVTMEQYAGFYRDFTRWMNKEYSAVAFLRDVTLRMAEEYIRSLMDRRLVASSINKYLNFLTMFYRVLHDEIRMKNRPNPFVRIKRRRIVPNSRRELTIEELRTVCESAEGPMRLLFGIGIYTGLRLGDCATLRWSEIDMHRRVIQRIPNKTARRNGKHVSVPIHATLYGMLGQIPQEKRGDYLLPALAATYKQDPSKICRAVQQHFTKCGIRVHRPGTGLIEEEGPDGKMIKKHSGTRAVVEVGFHSLRHTFVSLCRGANAPLAVVEAIVGHSNPAMTRHYTHVGDAAASSAVAALPSLGLMSTPESVALPITTSATIPVDKVRELAQKLTPITLVDIKAAILALCADVTTFALRS